MGIRVTTAERVQAALDVDTTAYRSDHLLRALDASTAAIQAGLHWAHFHPVVATRLFNWPNDQHARPWRLYLENQGLISVTTLTAGGVVIPSTDYFLEPVNEGPPYQWIEIDLGSSASFNSGSSHQQAISVAGLWGVRNDETAAGALAEALDSSETEVDVTNGAAVGVGSLLRVDSERMNVTGRAWMDSTFNLAGDMNADRADTLLVVSGGTWFAGESILFDTEQVAVKAVAGSNLTVERAVNGTVLAAHTGAVDLYVSRRLTVERGAAGTTAAAHSDAAPLAAWQPPPTVEALGVALAMDQVEQETGAYSRQIRSGDAAAAATGGGGSNVGTTASGLGAAWAAALAAHGRLRTGVVG